MNTSHYPSLELCKKLTEIGFPEETSCHFRKNNSDTYEHTFGPWNDESYVCPSVMEMLDEMPENSKFELYNQWDNEWTVTWYYTDDEEQKHRKVEYRIGTLQNALAEMILWLHDNNYINFK